MKGDPIDWEKLLAYLDTNENKKMEDMSEEEIDMLLYAEDIRGRLRGEKPGAQFPLAEGMQEFAKGKKKRYLRRLLMYAATVIAIVGVGLWAFVDNQQIVPSNKTTVAVKRHDKAIKLKLGNGKEVFIGSHSGNVQDQGNDISITENMISYMTKNGTDNRRNTDAMNILEVPAGMRTKIVLSDGTQVWINSGTTIKYPIVFNKTKREVYLEGEAYFDVAHDAKRMFIVHSRDLQIKVLGTAFVVNTLNERIRTALVRGRVDMEVNKQVQRLLPGEVGQYNSETAKLSLSDEDIRGLIAWRDNKFFFDNSNLSEITKCLERTYDYDFVFDNPKLKTLTFTIDIEQTEDIDTILSFLRLSSPAIDFRITGRTIHITDKNN